MNNDVSIVIPVYNNINIINSLFTKINKKLKYCNEVIIIDDASSDATHSAIIKYYKNNKKIHVLRNKINSGPSFSRNIGINFAKSKYVALLDSDDDWHPQKLAFQIALMEFVSADVCGTGYEILRSNENRTPEIIKSFFFNEIRVKNIVWPNVLFGSPFPTPSVIINKRRILARFDESFRFAEDFEFWVRLSKDYKVIKICESLTFTFKHDFISNGSSLSGNLKLMQCGEQRIFVKNLKYPDLNLYIKFFLKLAQLYSKVKYMRRIIIFFYYKYFKK
jgi:teichuronic acid biosynthesis glycosyltransferase TuaG